MAKFNELTPFVLYDSFAHHYLNARWPNIQRLAVSDSIRFESASIYATFMINNIEISLSIDAAWEYIDKYDAIVLRSRDEFSSEIILMGSRIPKPDYDPVDDFPQALATDIASVFSPNGRMDDDDNLPASIYKKELDDSNPVDDMLSTIDFLDGILKNF